MRSAPRPVSLALQELTGVLAPASTLARVQELWEDAAGAAAAAHARPAHERDGVLTVICDEAVWAQELTLMGDRLLARLNAALAGSPLRELRCRTG
jgi:predicted nucleic acid-binding Zn ribbon protein